MSHHFTVEVRRDDDRVIGWRCADTGCTAAESVGARAEREEADAAATNARAVTAAARAAAKAHREEAVAWRCGGNPNYGNRPGCGVVLHLPRVQAEARWFCCSACRKSAPARSRIASAERVPCEACGAKGAA